MKTLDSKRRIRITGKVQLWVVKRPKGWKPKDWKDIPDKLVMLWKEVTVPNHAHAFDTMFGFNSASMANDGSIWMIAVSEPRYEEIYK